MALIGIGNTLCDVSSITLLQRAAPEDVLARVFGVMETLILATIALGGSRGVRRSSRSSTPRGRSWRAARCCRSSSR